MPLLSRSHAYVSASPFGSAPVADSDTEPPSPTVYGPSASTVGPAFSRSPTMIGSWSDDRYAFGSYSASCAGGLNVVS